MSQQLLYYGYIDSNDRKMNVEVAEYFNCSCTLSSSCLFPIGIIDVSDINSTPTSIIIRVPIFFLGCYPIDGLMKSTLECFYNLSCMLELDIFVLHSPGYSFNFSNLNRNLNLPNETIELIINRLMIDSWNLIISFSSYFNTCSPLTCTYEYIDRNNLFFTITTILGIFAGLSLGLKLIILIILRFIENIIDNHSLNEFIIMIKSLFVCNTEQRMIHRLHLIFLLLTLFSLFLSSAFQSKSITVHIIKPSLSNYKDLLKDYSNSLRCSCSRISIPYEKFLHIKPHFHDICSSQFISDEWIHYLYGEGNLSLRFSFDDYRYSAPGQFRSLSSLCKLTQEKVNDTLSHLLTSYYINSQLLSEILLLEQIEIILNQLQSTEFKSFLNVFNLIREILGSNMIMSAWITNWEYVYESEYLSSAPLHTVPISYGPCNCGFSFKCTQLSQGMMSGCYPLESILQTKLYCFYDQNCIDSNGNFRRLNITMLQISQFNLNSTIESILNNLMIEEYKSDISYENYFNQCKPSSCSYSYIKTHDITQTTMFLVSLYGGLVLITRCLAVIFAKIYQYRRNQIDPETLQQNI